MVLIIRLFLNCRMICHCHLLLTPWLCVSIGWVTGTFSLWHLCSWYYSRSCRCRASNWHCPHSPLFQVLAEIRQLIPVLPDGKRWNYRTKTSKLSFKKNWKEVGLVIIRAKWFFLRQLNENSEIIVHHVFSHHWLHRGQNYGTNTISIVHLATLTDTVPTYCYSRSSLQSSQLTLPTPAVPVNNSLHLCRCVLCTYIH